MNVKHFHSLAQSKLKKNLRRNLQHDRKTLSKDECHQKSLDISERFLRSALVQSSTFIQFYLANRFEVQTDIVILKVLRQKKRIAVPVIDVSHLFFLSELTDPSPGSFQEGPFGIRQLQPAMIKRVDISEIDLWVVPGIGFDKIGNRLGYGGGYYDHALSCSRGKRIALAFDMQIVDQIPVESTDQPMDLIFTETQTIDCKEERRVHNTN
ncbi:MAG: 5-formyltetrahydrofolate cyclo-ligase [Nitrospiria bacterium]